MKISEEIKNAIENNLPVVALETTIISHGMPYPKNVECALKVEKEIRKYGVIPATIGIIDGEPIIGMNKDQIEEFGKRKGIVKVSRRDLPICISKKMWGATTVAATMILAYMAGIKFFVTGGIGGCQKGATNTFDISADLEELSKTDVCVICAGPKAILDIPLTLEVLETKGVPIISFNSETIPLFYTNKSEYKPDYNAKNPYEIATICKTKWDYKLAGGVLVTNPIPEEYSMNSKEINKAIEEAQKEMENRGIKGKDETPFLLSKIVELTNGKSLEANIRLILNNAKVGAQIAKEYFSLNK